MIDLYRDSPTRSKRNRLGLFCNCCFCASEQNHPARARLSRTRRRIDQLARASPFHPGFKIPERVKTVSQCDTGMPKLAPQSSLATVITVPPLENSVMPPVG